MRCFAFEIVFRVNVIRLEAGVISAITGLLKLSKAHFNHLPINQLIPRIPPIYVLRSFTRPMGKKKAAPAVSKSAAKAAKKAKAAQKIERKQTKKSGKGKGAADDDDDEQDLEAILENVGHFLHATRRRTPSLPVSPQADTGAARAAVDASRVGGRARCDGGARRGPAEPPRKRDADRMPKRESHLVYRWRVLQ
jgi:hypothetical protein